MKHPEHIKHVEAFIISMTELKARYAAAIKLGISKWDYELERGMKCLLCSPIGVDESRGSHGGPGFYESCANIGCPWIVMTGMICDDWSRYNLKSYKEDHRTVYNSYNKDVMQARIKQIDEWIEIYIAHRDLGVLP